MKHLLKTWPEPFAAVVAGYKTHEVRVNDRGFKVGDQLELAEYRPDIDKFTGRVQTVDVTYISVAGTFGLPIDLCVLSIRRVHP